ncbi:MAG: Uma2 family endonuclease [Solirubrobacterales bacterium]|nr:Uma2 family endonuclease [Solirubrobacterales bacterium]
MAVPANAPSVTTAEELWRMPGDALRRELVHGELREMSPAGARHGRVASAVGGLLRAHVSQTGCGVTFGAETGFVLSRDPDTVRAPDAAFISRARFAAVGDTEKFWPGAPDLAVEVLSPQDSFQRVQEKALEWIDSGCAAVMVLDPDRRSATIYRPGGRAQVHGVGETLDLDDAVPGFTVVVQELFD